LRSYRFNGDDSDDAGVEFAASVDSGSSVAAGEWGAVVWAVEVAPAGEVVSTIGLAASSSDDEQAPTPIARASIVATSRRHLGR
jgi:hypothetical protein